MKLKTNSFALIILLLLPFASVYGAGTVGTGTPGSCTEAALDNALAGGGLVTFNCGGAHTIVVTNQKTITTDTTIDGGGLITISGGNSTRILNVQNGANIVLRNITIANGNSGGNNGGGIYVERLSTLTVENSTFSNNTGYNGGGIATNGWGANDTGVVVTISDSTFNNNNATAPAIPGGGNGGGGMYLSGGSSATVTDSTFSSNQSVNGGGIHLLHSNLYATDVIFVNNVANNTAGGGGGGAIYMDGTKGMAGEVRVTTSTFTSNSTNQLGGAIFSFPEGTGAFYIDQSTFDGNTSNNRGMGGAIYHQSASTNELMRIDNSTFVNNRAVAGPADSASQGGAIWSTLAQLEIANSTFVNNDATHSLAGSLAPDNWRRGFGGAIRTSEATTIVNSTIVNNRAGFVGGALAGGATVRNTIIANNTGENPWDIQQNCTVVVTNGGNNMQYPQKTTGNGNDYECFGSQTAVNPLLGTVGNYGGQTQTVPLLNGSPAINAGSNCSANDQRGFPRNGQCDIGAYEFGAGIVLSGITPSMAGLNDVQSFTLAVQGAGFGPNSVVRWAGADRPTTYVNSQMITAVIPTTDVDSLGTFNITVYDPDRTLESDSLPFAVVQTIQYLYLPTILR